MVYLLALITLLFMAACPASAGPRSSTPPIETAAKGIAAGWGWDILADAELDRRLDECARLGARWIRFDVPWADIQANGADSWNWHRSDSIIPGVVARGMKPLPILDTTPSWARPAPTDSYWTAPADPATYAAFVAEFVKRYTDVDSIEIWNEPNIITFWPSGPNAVQYGHLLRAAYHAAKSVRPSITVVSGGLAPATTSEGNIPPADFVLALYSGGYNAYFDALGMHPYTHPALPGATQRWNSWYQMESQIRPIMEAYGDTAKKVWMTEYGAPTGGAAGTYVTEAQQLEQMQTAYNLARSYSWAGPLFWYSFKDLNSSDRADREKHFGIIKSDWAKKAAYDFFKNLP